MKWFDVRDYLADLRAISIFIGGRGIGKTYSALDFVYQEHEPFIYLRNTDVQLDECCGAFGNPFKKLNIDKGYSIEVAKEKKHAVIIDHNNDDQIIGYGCALSTFDNLRGVDLSDVKYVIFDEFIEKKTLKFDQKRAFDNFYETVNRNRELFGETPLICILLSNAQKLDNPILAGYECIPIIEGMTNKHQQKHKFKNIFLCLPESEISDLKKNTTLYQNIEGTKEYDEFISNKFANDSFYAIKKRPLQEYVGICAIDGIYIYKHKSQKKYYATFKQFTNANEFTSKDNKLLFMRSYGRYLQLATSDGSLEYDSFVVKSRLMKILIL